MRRLLAVLAVIVAAMSVGTAVPVVAASAGVTENFCGISWGSLPKAANSTSVAALTNVRAGQHACYDRLVLDFQGKTNGYRVEYVEQVTLDGTFEVVPVRGGAKLDITAEGPANDNSGRHTYEPANQRDAVNVSGWRTFRQVAWAGSIDGHSEIGLGVRARLPFRVFYLDGPGAGSRLVIDVAHRWSSAGTATPAGAAPVRANTTESFCGISWGSLPKAADSRAVAPLTNVRGGQHACYDRLVLDFKGKTNGYQVQYVNEVIAPYQTVVPVRGGARLRIFAIAPAYEHGDQNTYSAADYSELVNVSGWRTFRQVAWAGGSEGLAIIGLGVRARLPFRVFYLDGPGAGSRLVIDVAHRWS